MFIKRDPDAHVSTSSYTTCAFHTKYPDIHDYAGCTCTASWGLRKATPEEYKENRKRRLEYDERRRKAFEEFNFMAI